MTQSFFRIMIFSAVFLSCSNKQTTKLLSPNNLTSYFVTISSDSGYRLKTPNGGVIKILPNTFDVPRNTAVKIEIKEAYSIQDILLAGLATESNKKPLRSAGMLYFKATTNNSDVKFLKPIQATIPSKSFDERMKMYKGVIQEDSTINWVNPKSIDTSLAAKQILLGKALFNANCANCHKATEEFTGPPLAGARQRAPDLDWAYQFVNNTNLMLKYDSYARYLLKKYASKMTQFNLKSMEIKAILDYCDNEAFVLNKRSDSLLFANSLIDQSCGYDTLYYPKPRESVDITTSMDTSFVSSTLDTIPNTLRTVPNDTSSSGGLNENKKDEFIEKGYKPVFEQVGMYKLNIDESGWYNIDILFHDTNAVKVQLLAKIESQENMEMLVYLCIPNRKILVNADMHNYNDNTYIFHYSDADGYIPLVLGDDAIIFAITSSNEKVYYGIRKFKVEEHQTVVINTKKSNKDQIIKALKSNRLDSIQLDIEKMEMEIIKIPCNRNRYQDEQDWYLRMKLLLESGL